MLGTFDNSKNRFYFLLLLLAYLNIRELGKSVIVFPKFRAYLEIRKNKQRRAAFF